MMKFMIVAWLDLNSEGNEIQSKNSLAFFFPTVTYLHYEIK